MPGRPAIWAVSVFALLSGCSRRSRDRGGDGTRAQAGPEDEVEVCLAILRAEADWHARCEDTGRWLGSIAAAVERVRPACEAAVRAPGTSHRRETAEACAAARAKQPCDAPGVPDACVNPGTLEPGSVCVFAEQCSPGTSCEYGPDYRCGVCRRLPREGEACLDECARGFRCTAEKVCARRGARGAPCFGGFDCDDGHQCVGDRINDAATCQPLRAVGESCGGDVGCVFGLLCDGGTCRQRPMPGKPGAACDEGQDCIDFSCVAGKCAALAKLGQPCSDAVDAAVAHCEPAFWCADGKCVPRSAAACSAEPPAP